MMGKLAGAALLLCACTLWCTVTIRRWRGEIRLARELGAALERMEGMIRWQNLPLPKIVERESRRKPCGIYFERIAAAASAGKPLQACWNDSWREMEYSALGELLCGAELEGDARQIMGSLHMTAQFLYQKSEEWQQGQHQKERLCITASAALTAMTAIILI